MKAVVQDQYGPPGEVLAVRDIAMPELGRGDVLVKVRAASVHPDVWHVVTGLPYVLRLMGNGVLRPKFRVPGSDLAGVVQSVGADVTRFKAGDEVFGETTTFAWKNGGAFAEYVSVSQELLALKPTNVSFEQAATVPTSGFIGLSNLRQAGALDGRNVLINGAGGCVGALAIQFAKAGGAQVTAVDCAEKLPMMLSLGADRAIDYAKTNVLRAAERYDVVLDVASNWWFDVCEPILAAGGAYIPIGHSHFGRAQGRMGGRVVGSLPAFVGVMMRTEARSKKVGIMPLTKGDAMRIFASMLEAGQLTPVVARTFPLDEAADAMNFLEQGRVVGRIVMLP